MKHYVSVLFKEGGEEVFADVVEARVVEGVLTIGMEKEGKTYMTIFPVDVIFRVDTFYVEMGEVQ